MIAQAWLCQPQASQSTLLARKHQKPQFLLRFDWDATSQAAKTKRDAAKGADAKGAEAEKLPGKEQPPVAS